VNKYSPFWQPDNGGLRTRKKKNLRASYLRKFPHSKKSTNKHWFHESAEITFSFYQYAHDMLWRRFVLLKRRFYDSAKSHFPAQKRRKFLHSLRGTLKQWFHESAEIVFGGCQNFWQFFLKQSLVHAKSLLKRSLVPLKRGFHDSEKLHFLKHVILYSALARRLTLWKLVYGHYAWCIFTGQLKMESVFSQHCHSKTIYVWSINVWYSDGFFP